MSQFETEGDKKAGREAGRRLAVRHAARKLGTKVLRALRIAPSGLAGGRVADPRFVAIFKCIAGRLSRAPAAERQRQPRATAAAHPPALMGKGWVPVTVLS